MYNRKEDQTKKTNTPTVGKSKKKTSGLTKLLHLYVDLIICVFLVITLITVVAVFIKAFTPAVDIPEDILNSEIPVNVDSQGREEITDGQDIITDLVVNEIPEGEKIYLDMFTDPIGTPYKAVDKVYTTFATDNPDYTDLTVKTIVIDPGHQSYTGAKKSDVWLSPYLDPAKSSSWVYNHYQKLGAEGVSTGKAEYTITHTIAKKLKTELEARGYTVILTKSDENVSMLGAERAAVANRNDADLMISLHCDGYDGDSSVSGTLALAPAIWDGYPDKNLSYLSEKAAILLLDSYSQATGLNNRGYQKITSSSIFSFCKVPVVLLEMGYLTNPAEDRLLNSTDFQQKMVEGIANGIDRYFNSLTFRNN